MNRKYRVICLAVSGRNNKVFRNGDVVSEGAFPDGRAEQYVKSKHMERVEESDDLVSADEDLKTDEDLNDQNQDNENQNETITGDKTPADDGEGLPEMTKKDDAPSDEDHSDEDSGSQSGMPTKAEIKKELTKRGVSYNPKATKEELYRLYLL